LGYIAPKLKMDDKEFLLDVQKDLYKLSAFIAGGRKPLMSERVEKIEHRIDEISDVLPPLKAFVHPGGTEEASLLHIARSVCRRAERRTVTAERKGLLTLDEVIRYLNRLSDLLFQMARKYNTKEGVESLLK